VISLASEIRKDFVNAPSQFKAIFDEYVSSKIKCPVRLILGIV
jgi:hypothetical protein